jgi:hypothetical protein
MGKINNYQVDTPAPGDKILGSADSNGSTKNFTAQSIADLGRSSKVYRAFLTQFGINAPSAVVVDGNTITGTWTYGSTGVYTFTSTGSFGSVNAGCIVGASGNYDTTYEFAVANSNSISFKTYGSGTLANGQMTGVYVEIFTYPV